MGIIYLYTCLQLEFTYKVTLSWDIASTVSLKVANFKDGPYPGCEWTENQSSYFPSLLKDDIQAV